MSIVVRDVFFSLSQMNHIFILWNWRVNWKDRNLKAAQIQIMSTQSTKPQHLMYCLKEYPCP